MQLTGADETDLLTALYDGAFDEPFWSTFLERLRSRIGADSAMILFRREELSNDFVEVRTSGAYPEDLHRLYMNELYRLDPIPYLAMKPERVYALSEFVNDNHAGHARFREEIIEQFGLRFARFVRVTEPGGASAWCIVTRGDRDFAARDGALLKALAPHLRIALRGLATLQRERLRAAISGDVVQRLNFGWLALDAGGHVVDMDGEAENLLQRSAILRRARQGRLMPARVAADRELSEVLRSVRDGTAIRPRLIHLSDEPWLDMLVLPLKSEGTFQPGQPVATAYIQGDRQPGTERRDQLVRLFGLSQSEASLALALSRGKSIAQAAEELDMPLESARTYTKRIYAKTSTRGQADLVRLILASVVALA